MPPTDPSSIEKRATQIFAAGQITRDDQDSLMSIFASKDISDRNEALINQIYDALAAGKIRVVE